MTIYLNNEKITPTIFPDKTSQVWKLNSEDVYPYHNLIKWDFESEAELFHIAQLRALLNTLVPDATVILNVPYFPYARQDKEIDNESTFALRIICDYLKSMNFTKVITYDVHNPELTKQLLPNLYNETPEYYITHIPNLVNADLIVFPDKGAEKRYAHLTGLTCITMQKVRNQLTGDLSMSGFTYGDEVSYKDQELSLNGKTLLIVDDLADGGGTFILAAQELKKLGAKEVNLFTSHGLYTKGLTPLREAGINRIFNKKGEVE